MKQKFTDFDLKELIERIRQSIDIIDLVEETVKLTRKGNRYWGLCPFHQEKTPSFSVSPDKNRFYCFGCHAAGDIYAFIMKRDNLGFMEAVKMLAARAGIQLSSKPSPDTQKAFKAAQAKRKKEAAINGNIDELVKAARLKCFDVERLLYSLKRFIFDESSLDRSGPEFALKHLSYIEYINDLFLGSPEDQAVAANLFWEWVECQKLTG